MKITEETKIKDLIPEWYELDIESKYEFYETEQKIRIPVRKKEVKDFKWYCEKYFNEITPCYNENDHGNIIESDFDHVSFESKIGLLKFICDDLNYSWLEITDMHLDNPKNPDSKFTGICPPEFLNSIFK